MDWRLRCASGISGANSPITVSIASQVNGQLCHLFTVMWSYSAAPTGGNIAVTHLSGDDVAVDITQGGAGQLVFPPAPVDYSQTLEVTLAAAGAAVVGKLSVFYAFFP